METIPEKNMTPKKIAVVGLGYVGLPLAVEFSRLMPVIGFDINRQRIEELKSGQDHTRETSEKDLADANIEFTSEPDKLNDADVIVIAVPTPIDSHRNPDLNPVLSASRLVGKNMRKGCIVVYESTVYPGLTEELCVPILEQESGMKAIEDFGIGYSPERINPGDKKHTLKTIKKIVSGSDPHTLHTLEELYGSIIEAGIHSASSIKVAEAAKVIENTQRDLNIALMNELAVIFEKMGIDTLEVLEAAGSKWNFLPFRPGLVGGHCIGVDPYYLTYKAESLGLHPEVILAGRRINDRMGKYIAEMAIKNLISRGVKINDSRIGILGLTFKENVPDLRNTKVMDLVQELKEYGATVFVADTEAHPEEALKEYGIELVPLEKLNNLDALILAVSHNAFLNLNPDQILKFFANPQNGVVLDVKGALDGKALQAQGLNYWRL